MKFLLNLCTIFSAATLMAQSYDLPMSEGKFEPTDESLKRYECPEWFRDAKFGIWSHWGPQAVPRLGDWYAKKMYLNDRNAGKSGEHDVNPDPAYLAHIERHGHPSEFGYKDIIDLWKAERWSPEELMALYKRAGAKYFVSMATHHDNFFLWDSQIHRWNSVDMGPQRDVVGEWQVAAKRNGLYFGVSEHLGASYTWFQPSHGADPSGKYAGVPYDGADPQYQDLYHKKAAAGDTSWLTVNPEWHQEWYDRIKEVVDMYKPDLLYSDSKLPFEDVGRSLVAHYYNNTSDRKGAASVVYTCKEESEGRFVRDVERGALEGISPYPWQTDTSIGDWYYRTGQKYMTSVEVVKMLVDIVSKNGNLLLNVVQTPEGDLEQDVIDILEGIASWIEVNGEAIYGTRPWSVYAEGPSLTREIEKGRFGGVKDVLEYLPGDLRFTQKGNTLYAFSMMPLSEDVTIKSIGARKVKSIKILGSEESVAWSQKDGVVTITKPHSEAICETLVFEIELKK